MGRVGPIDWLGPAICVKATTLSCLTKTKPQVIFVTEREGEKGGQTSQVHCGEAHRPVARAVEERLPDVSD